MRKRNLNRFCFTGFSHQSLIAFIALLTLFSACRKAEDVRDVTEQNSTETKLFNLSGINDPDIKAFAMEMKRQSIEERFADGFLEKNGIPRWNRSEKIKASEGILAVIPFALEGKQEMNGFIIAKRDYAGAFSFSLYRKDLLNTYGFDEGKSLTASKVQTIINHFNQSEFGVSKYRLADNRQLPLSVRKGHPGKDKKEMLSGHIKTNRLLPRGGEPPVSAYLQCMSYLEETEWWWDPDGEDDPCDCSGNEYYVYSTFETVTVCWDSGGGGGSGSGGTGDGTGGTGDGGSGSGWWNPGGGGTGGSGVGPTYALSQQLDAILQPGDSYYFPDNTMDAEPVPDNHVFNSVAEFENYISHHSESFSVLDQGDEKTLEGRVNLTFVAGVDIFVKIKKDNLNIFKVEQVTSEDWGWSLGWSWSQSTYSSSTTGDITAVEIIGKVKYNVIIEGIGTVYTQKHHYQIKFNRLTGEMLSLAKMP
jgi:hypothetical protein